nr:MAG: hypothetical protein DIU54_06235 [Acidobacteriota bacterium]
MARPDVDTAGVPHASQARSMTAAAGVEQHHAPLPIYGRLQKTTATALPAGIYTDALTVSIEF